MNKIIYVIRQLLSYSRPNSFISYIDNIFAIIIFILIKKIKWLTPNILTAVSLILWLVAIFGFIFWNWRYCFVFLAIISYTFDNLDGIWARYFNLTSNFGAWFDGTCDRIKDTFILCAFVFAFQGSYLMIFSLIALILFFLSEFLEIQVGKYFKPRLVGNIEVKVDKRYRLLAFGPAEALILYSLTILLPFGYKTIPLVFFSFAMILILWRVRKSYEFFC